MLRAFRGLNAYKNNTKDFRTHVGLKLFIVAVAVNNIILLCKNKYNSTHNNTVECKIYNTMYILVVKVIHMLARRIQLEEPKYCSQCAATIA